MATGIRTKETTEILYPLAKFRFHMVHDMMLIKKRRATWFYNPSRAERELKHRRQTRHKGGREE
jgi:hypothetical protein